MTTEKINIKLTLSGRYWDNKPKYAVLLNDKEITRGVVNEDSGEKFTVEFEEDLPEEVEHKLIVKFFDKTDYDTVENEDKTAILKDMLLNIESLEFDGINVGELLWTNSEYFMHDGEYMKECVNLGKNGEWVFKFSCPFYIWLLENM